MKNLIIISCAFLVGVIYARIISAAKDHFEYKAGQESVYIGVTIYAMQNMDTTFSELNLDRLISLTDSIDEIRNKPEFKETKKIQEDNGSYLTRR